MPRLPLLRRHVSGRFIIEVLRLKRLAVPLAFLPPLALLVWSFGQAPWPRFWAAIVGAYLLAKAYVWWRDRPRHVVAPLWRHFAFLWAWPGMDPRRFLDPERRAVQSGSRDLLWGAGFVVAGALLWHHGLPVVEGQPLWVRGVVAITALGWLLFFGAARLLCGIWRRLGVDCAPQWDRPLLAPSVSEFWRRRWNRAFHRIALRHVYAPLVAPLGRTGASLAVFVSSGVAHEFVISLPAGGGYGLPSAFFGIQAAGIAVQQSALGRRLGLDGGWPGWLFAVCVIAGASGLLFHAPFLERVIFSR